MCVPSLHAKPDMSFPGGQEWKTPNCFSFLRIGRDLYCLGQANAGPNGPNRSFAGYGQKNRQSWNSHHGCPFYWSGLHSYSFSSVSRMARQGTRKVARPMPFHRPNPPGKVVGRQPEILPLVAWPTDKLAGRNIRISQNCGQFSGQGETRAKSIRLRPGRWKGIDLAKSLDLAPGSFRQNLSATAPDVSTGLQVDLRTPCGRESVVAVPYGELTGVPSISAWRYRHWIKCRKSTMTVCLT